MYVCVCVCVHLHTCTLVHDSMAGVSREGGRDGEYYGGREREEQTAELCGYDIGVRAYGRVHVCLCLCLCLSLCTDINVVSLCT